MTGKTKRQLRAEAVERLKCMDEWCEEPKTAADFMKGLLWDLRVIDSESVRDALIDLLADDEPPEGDAVDKLREWLVDEANINELKNTWFTVTEQICRLDGMLDEIKREIERNYVRREAYDQLTAERDEWKAKAEAPRGYVGLRQGKVHKGEILSEYYCGGCGWPVKDHDSYCPECGGALHGGPGRAEHDGAERSMTNLEWLYRYDEFFNRFVRWYVTDGAKAEDDIQADEWLMAEHAPDCGQNADMTENAPDSARNDASASENGVSGGVDGPNDTREALEDDIWNGCDRLTTVKGELLTNVPWSRLIGWLDRQAAITERESFMRGRASLDDEFHYHHSYDEEECR